MRSHAWMLIALAACTEAPEEEAARSTMPHLELIGPAHAELREPQAAFYEAYLTEVERFLDIALPPIRLYETAWPRDCAAPYCEQGDALVVLCHDLRRECMLALATAVVGQLPDMPAVLRAGLADALAGGLGHGDVLDDPIARDGARLTRLLDDAAYERARNEAFGLVFGDLAWLQGTVYPAGDFARHAIDRLGVPAALELFANARDDAGPGTRDAMIADWRAAPPRHGRGYRFALAECSPAYAIPTGRTRLPVMIQGVVFAPDLLASIARFGVGNFEVPGDALATVRVASALDGQPFVRLEACDGRDPAPLARAFPDAATVHGVAPVQRGRYFVVAGSDRVPTPSLHASTRPESIEIALAAGD